MSLYIKKILIESNLKLKNGCFEVYRDNIDLILNRIKPHIYYVWSKHKQENQNNILKIGALVKYGNWSKKSFFLRFLKHEIHIFKKIDEKLKKLKK